MANGRAWRTHRGSDHLPAWRCWGKLRNEPGTGRSKAHNAALDAVGTVTVTLGDVEREISRVYKDPANTAVPIGLLYPLAIERFKGLTVENLDAALDELRADLR